MRLAALMLLALLLALAPPAVLGEEANTTTTGEPSLSANCEPGEYAVNSSGTFICLPEMGTVNVSFASIYVVYNSTSNIYVLVTCFDPAGASGYVEIMDPDMNLIANITVSLAAGEQKSFVAALPQDYAHDYVVVHSVINGYDMGTYAVARQEESVLSITDIPVSAVAFMVVLGVVAPLLGIALRGEPRDAGIGLIGVGLLYTPLMHMLGLPSPVPELASAFAVITGFILFAVNPR